MVRFTIRFPSPFRRRGAEFTRRADDEDETRGKQQRKPIKMVSTLRRGSILAQAKEAPVFMPLTVPKSPEVVETVEIVAANERMSVSWVDDAEHRHAIEMPGNHHEAGDAAKLQEDEMIAAGESRISKAAPPRRTKAHTVKLRERRSEAGRVSSAEVSRESRALAEMRLSEIGGAPGEAEPRTSKGTSSGSGWFGLW
jgi:hypothetical protein